MLFRSLGLAVCFRSNVWNIGAEGQFVIGAVTAGGVALLAEPTTGPWIIPAILLAGVLGGMLWAGIAALLRDRFNANEILVTLMLVYVADLVLSYLVYGPWKDPKGFNFPQTKTFEKVTQIPKLFVGTRINIGLLIALFGVAGMWIICSAPTADSSCKWADWLLPRHGTRAFPHVVHCGRRSWFRAVPRVWLARLKSQAPLGN